MAKRSQYKMMYREEWETNKLFKDWIVPVPGDNRKARCKYCEVFLPAHFAGLCSHASDKKHLKKISAALSSSGTSSLPDQLKTEFKLVATEQIIEEDHQKSEEHIVSTTELWPEEDAKSRIKYQKRWHMNPEFADWLEPVKGDFTKAKCSLCGVILRAHFKDLERHMRTNKHIGHVQTPDVNKGFGDMAKASVNDSESEILITSEESSNWVPTRKRKLKTDKSTTVQGQPDKEISSLLSESGTDTMESQLLELECEAVDESNIASLVMMSNRSWSLKKNLLLNSTSIEEKPDQVPVPEVENVADPVIDAGQNDQLEVEDADLLRPGNDVLEVNPVTHSTKEVAETHSSETEMDNSYADDFEPPDKKYKLEKMGNAENSPEVKCEQLEDVLLHEFVEETDFEKMPVQRKKRASNSTIDWKRYKKMYRREWELDPVLSDWVAPIDGDKFKAACRFCGCVLRAHYTDLRQHCKTAKHNRNAYWHKNKSIEPVVLDSCATNEAKDDLEKPSKESKVSACYMLSKSPWSRYRKRYRKQWESDPQFQGWIAPVPGDDTRARCKYCRILLRAHFADLKNHSRTTKHANNIAYGQPFDDCLPISHPVFTSPRTASKQSVVNRKKKAGARGLSALNGANNLDLSRPDDSLMPIGNITNITSFAWGSLAVQETTLILPKHVHLDETLAASLPKTSPGALIRVKKEPGVADNVPVKKRKEKPLQQLTQEECNENALLSLTKSVTLWEFLMMKVEKSHPNSTRPRLETILLEFKALQEQVKSLGQEQLTPMTLEDGMPVSGQNDVLVIESEELAQSLGVPVGAYKIKDPANPRMTRNTAHLLSNTTRRRLKQNPTSDSATIGLPRDQMALSNSIQKLVGAGQSEISPLFISSDRLRNLKFVSYDMDGQYTDCSNLLTVNGHCEGDGDVQLLVVPISEDTDQETLNTIIQRVPVTNVTVSE